MSLALTYAKRQMIEMLRAPVMFITITLTPVATMVFFFVPFIGDDPYISTLATATLVVFAVLLGCVLHFGITIAALRESPWGTYLRTLPGGLTPQVVSNLLTGSSVVLVAAVPITIVAALFLPVTSSLAQVLTAVVALLPAVINFTVMGMAIGYTMSVQGASLVGSIGVLPLAVGGGMFFDPADTPAIIETISPYVPTSGASDLVRAALADYRPNAVSLVMLAVWTVALGAVAVWGYRRDEGRRFR